MQIPIKHKPLQVRHSLLDKLDEASKPASDVLVKRPKRDDNMVSGHMTRHMMDVGKSCDFVFQSTMSEYGSGDSTNGEQEQENDHAQKSPAPGEKSPSQSSSSSTHADDEGDSPCSSGSAPRPEQAERPSSSTPQQFMRVSKDTESTCARTDLVYVHLAAAEKEMATSTTKVCVLSVCTFVCVYP